MSNLNDGEGRSDYGERHEHGNGGIPQRDGARVEDGHDASESSPAHEASIGPGADLSRMGDGGSTDGVGDQGIRPAYQQELPGFEHASIQIARAAPLPDPGELAGYDQVSPGAAEMILRVYERNAQVTADATERNSIAEAGAIDRTSKAESMALKIFAVGYVGLPIAALVTGLVLAILGVQGGIITAVIGGVAVLAESMGRAFNSRRKASSDLTDDSDVEEAA